VGRANDIKVGWCRW